MATIERSRGDLRAPVLTPEEAEMAKAAQRCIMAALDHSRAPSIALIDEENHQTEPSIKLPPKALRLVANVLGAMGERKPIVLVPTKHELTTVEVAQFLNVSRPFVIKEIEANRLPCRKVGSHRRIAYEDMMAYRAKMRADQEAALQRLADDADDLGFGY